MRWQIIKLSILLSFISIKSIDIIWCQTYYWRGPPTVVHQHSSSKSPKSSSASLFRITVWFENTFFHRRLLIRCSSQVKNPTATKSYLRRSPKACIYLSTQPTYVLISRKLKGNSDLRGNPVWTCIHPGKTRRQSWFFKKKSPKNLCETIIVLIL